MTLAVPSLAADPEPCDSVEIDLITDDCKASIEGKVLTPVGPPTIETSDNTKAESPLSFIGDRGKVFNTNPIYISIQSMLAGSYRNGESSKCSALAGEKAGEKICIAEESFFSHKSYESDTTLTQRMEYQCLKITSPV